MDGATYDPVEFGKFGFGTVRTLRQYEKYAGLEFSTRRIHQDSTKKGHEYLPPSLEFANRTEEEFESGLISVFKHFLDIWHEELVERDYEFIVVALHGANGDTIYRKDFQPAELAPIVYNDKTFKVFPVEAANITKPAYWVVWPYSTSKGWGKRLTGEIK